MIYAQRDRRTDISSFWVIPFCHIQDDGLGWVWFSSHNGIFRVARNALREFARGERTKVHSVAYGLADGLPTLECAGGFQPAGCRTRDGRL